MDGEEEILRVGDFVVSVQRQAEGRRNRKYIVCMATSGNDPEKKCQWRKRLDFSEENITEDFVRHVHKFAERSIAEYFRRERAFDGPKLVLEKVFMRFLCTSNLSIRQGVSYGMKDVINCAIEYGKNLSRSDISTPDALWTLSDRKKLRDMIVRYGDSICTEKVNSYANKPGSGVSSILLDCSKLNHRATCDIVLVYRLLDSVDMTLFRTVEMASYTTSAFKKVLTDSIVDLHMKGVEVRAIISDGFSSQQSAFSPKSRKSIQQDQVLTRRHPFLEKIQWIYCRAHLLNLVVKDWLRLSEHAHNSHKYLGQIAVQLRKRQAYSQLNAICPEQIATRFVYDHRIIVFIRKHRQAIAEKCGIVIDPVVFAYGVLLEILWHLMGRFESRSCTLGDSVRFVNEAIENLERIAAKAASYETDFADGEYQGCEVGELTRILSNEALLMVELIKNRFWFQQSQLAELCFSLTVEGCSYLRSQVGLSLLLDEEPVVQRTGIGEDYFFFVVLQDIHVERQNELEAEYEEIVDQSDEGDEEDDWLPKTQNDEEGVEEDSFESEDDRSDVEEPSIVGDQEVADTEPRQRNTDDDAEYTNEEEIVEEWDGTLEGMRQRVARMDRMRREQGVVTFTRPVISELGRLYNLSEESMKLVYRSYTEWVSGELRGWKCDNIFRGNPMIMWRSARHSSIWRPLSEIAEIITAIPASEIENERIFGLKRRIIGQHGVRSSPELLTARVRIATS